MDIFKKIISSCFDNFYFEIGFFIFVFFLIFSDYSNEEKFGLAIFAIFVSVFIRLPYNILKKGIGLIESSDEKNKSANIKTLGTIFVIIAAIILYWALSLKI